MALPPSPISGDPGAVPPPDAGVDPDAGNPDEGTEDEVLATILRTSDGKLKLVAGDEPEEGEGMPPGAPGEAAGTESAAPEGQTFDTPGALMQALMPILDGGSTDAAEKSFGDNFRSTSKGGSDMAAPPLAG